RSDRTFLCQAAPEVTIGSEHIVGGAGHDISARHPASVQHRCPGVVLSCFNPPTAVPLGVWRFCSWCGSRSRCSSCVTRHGCTPPVISPVGCRCEADVADVTGSLLLITGRPPPPPAG